MVQQSCHFKLLLIWKKWCQNAKAGTIAFSREARKRSVSRLYSAIEEAKPALPCKRTTKRGSCQVLTDRPMFFALFLLKWLEK